MLTFSIRGAEDVLRGIANVEKQIAFASANALNRIAKEVQAFETGRELPSRLKLRGTWWRPGSKYGVNIKFAKKYDLVAVVGSSADWLRLQESGGTKKAPKVALAIPTDHINTDVRRRTRDKPGPLLQAGAFIRIAKTGVAVILKPVGGKRNRRLEALYVFKPTAKVPKRLDFEKDGNAIALARYQAVFLEELGNAIRTAR